MQWQDLFVMVGEGIGRDMLWVVAIDLNYSDKRRSHDNPTDHPKALHNSTLPHPAR